MPSFVPGWDINPYLSSFTASLAWYAPVAGSSIAATAVTGGSIVNPAAGTDFSTLIFEPDFNRTSNAAMLGGGTFFLAFQFSTAAAVTQNAWVEVTTSASNGFPAQINRWAYAPVGEPNFFVGTVPIPEAGSASLGLLAAGALGMRRRRAA